MIPKLPNLTHRLAILLPLVLLLGACDLLQEPKPPTFSNTLEFPLLRTSVTLKDLENQDNIETQLYPGDSNRTIFAYNDFSEMDPQEVGDQLAFGDITKSFSQSVDDVTVTGSNIQQTSGFDAVDVAPIGTVVESAIGNIELANIPASTTEPFHLDEVYPDITSLIDQTTAVPGGDLNAVEKPFSFSDFSAAVFVGGSLDITINNDMVIILGTPINIQLKDSQGNPIPDGLVTWDVAIPQGTSSTRSLDLAGMTLPGDILVEVTGSTMGTDGTAILVDAAATTSSFNIAISANDLVVSGATAKVPTQSIDETGSILMAESENIIQSARIKHGSLTIDIDNGLSVNAELVINISSLQDPDEIPFTTTIAIPSSGSISDTTDIANYFLVMELTQQEVQYDYQILTEDTGDDLVSIAESDQVSVSISLYGDQTGENLFFNRVTGIIEAQSIADSGFINISSESTLLYADISSGSLTITIENQVNREDFDALPTLFLTIPELVENGSSNPLTGSLILTPSPAANVLSFDLSDYALDLELDSQVLSYTTLVTTPVGELGRFGLEDSIYVDIVVSDMTFATVTGFFTQDAMVDSSEIVLNEATKLTEAVFETGDLTLTMTNRMGVLADVEFQLDEFRRRSNGDMLRVSFRLEETPDPQLRHIDLAEYDLRFDSALPGVDQAIHYVSTVTLPDDEEMTLTFGDSILIDVNITDLAMESVTGIIAADTLIIEETKQELSLPDMVSDLMFERVNIDIDFNSTFTIPIELSLTLSGTDSLGNTVVIPIVHELTPENDIVHIDAADILNIHPESIVAGGQAIIGGGLEASTIMKGQKMEPIMSINVPLSLIIDDPNPIKDIESSDIASPLPDDNTVTLDEVIIFTEAMNLFEFGAKVVVLASNDSLTFDSTAMAHGLGTPADTLLTLELLPLENTDPEIAPEVNQILLSSTKLQLFEERMYLKPEVTLLGNTDGQGNSLPSHFFTTDSLTVKTWGRITYTINGEEL